MKTATLQFVVPTYWNEKKNVIRDCKINVKIMLYYFKSENTSARDNHNLHAHIVIDIGFDIAFFP